MKFRPTGMSSQTNRKLLDKGHDFMRLHHYSIHSERTYCGWIKRYVQFHGMKSRQDLTDGEKKIEVFLTMNFSEQAPGCQAETLIEHKRFSGRI